MINYLAILIAAVLSYAIGVLWYSNILFGKTWMKLANIKKTKGSMAPKIVMGFIADIIKAFVLSIVFWYSAIASITEGMYFAFIIWLGFFGTVTLGSFLWEGKSFKLWIINNGYNLLSLLVMAIVIAF